MHIHDIQAFLTIVQTRNISKAADMLFLSQTAVTHRLKNLEKELGVTLLNRGRGIKEIDITPSGFDFLPIAKRWSALWEEIKKFKRQGEKLSLSFGSVQLLNDYVFPPLFKKLFTHKPKINLEIHTEHTAELYPLVEQRQVDVAIVWCKIMYPNVTCTPWKEVSMVLLTYGSSKYAGIKVVENKKLDTSQELYIPWTPTFKAWHDTHWPSEYHNPIHITGSPLTLQLIKDSGYWSIVPLWLAQYALKIGKYTYNLLSDPPEPMVAYSITHKYPRPSTEKSLRIFFEYLESTISTDIVD